jgi:NAD(P)-dependent dehydrogenase (short-subunit alcohol dehydrogenase family)
MTNPFRYDGKRVVVTGAFSGVGAALVDVLRAQGVEHITALDIRKPEGNIDDFIETDMGDEASVECAAAALSAPVDVLFNNAGIAATFAASKVMAVNYQGLRRLSEAVLPKIPRGGAIVNTASIAGGQWPGHLAEIQELLAIADWGAQAAWVTEKAELVADGYAFSKECVQVYTMASSRPTLEGGVRTNSVCPAPIDTPLMPDFRKTMGENIIDWTVANAGGSMATPEEVALTLAFLGTEAARYVNGVNLIVDAGFTAAMTTGQVDFSTIG